jgi:hypothetical protein
LSTLTTHAAEFEARVQLLSGDALLFEDTSQKVTTWLRLSASERARCRPFCVASARLRTLVARIQSTMLGAAVATSSASTETVTTASIRLNPR